MFGLCLCSSSSSPKVKLKSSHKYYKLIQQTLSQNQQLVLELIYNDLSSRHPEHLVTYENFLLFFGLTGLWGAKLFRKFDQDGRQLITKQQFFYGLSCTAKAPHSAKIRQLFDFFKDEQDNGIHYLDFTKMLYNYSRDELKQILIEDKCMIPELNRTISRNIQQSISDLNQSVLNLRPCRSQDKKQTVIQLNYQQPNQQQKSCFSKNYAEFSTYRDPGTILQLKLKDFTYKVNYCSMITLVKQFARKIYTNFNIDIKTGIFTYEQFNRWISSHRKLFESYYTSFHIDIWSYSDGQPNYLTKIQKQFTVTMRQAQNTRKVYAMLVQDVLIIAQSQKTKRIPIKVIYLEGLNFKDIKRDNHYCIQIYHRDDYYQKCILLFDSMTQQQSYLSNFRQYEGETLPDLYDAHQVIGTGKFSIVYRCTSKKTGKTYALKDICTQKLTTEATITLQNESQIMKIISHPQIVKYQQTIRSKSHIYIIAQYIYGRDLYEYVKRRGGLSEYISAFIIGKVIEAVIYLHSLQIIHRDLKPQNIMVMLKSKNHNQSTQSLLKKSYDQEIQNIKIIDFGLANHASELQKIQEKHGIAGTPNYIAPEIIVGHKPSIKSDIFSIGSILYFLLSAKLAFAYHNMELTLLKTARGDYNLTEGIWTTISDQAKDLINRLLNLNPEDRIGLQQALNHPWFQAVTKKHKGQYSINLGKNTTTQTGSELIFKQEILQFFSPQKQSQLLQPSEIDVQQIMKQQISSKPQKRARKRIA